MDYKTFDSKMQSDYLKIQAPYYNAVNPTKVVFENEKISVFVNSLGHIEFYDENEQSLGFIDLPASENPEDYGHSGQYGEVRCSVDGNAICIWLPVYDWEDGYPHCDGESDRWTRRVLRWFCVAFDCKEKQITVLDQK